MLKKTITYEDFNGDEVSEDFFFHLSKAELVELEMSHKGGLSEALKQIVETEDAKAIIAEFKGIILGSYGKKSSDGKRFVKTQELRDEFESSEAYSTLFMELVTQTDKAIEFINGIIPKDMGDDVAKVTALAPVPEPELEIVNPEDVKTMSTEEIEQLGKRIMEGKVKLAEPRDENIEHNETPTA